MTPRQVQPDLDSRHAAMKVLSDAVRKACEPSSKPHELASAPRAAVHAATSKTSPAADKTEDKTEHDSTRPLQDAVRAACGPDRPGHHH